MKRILVTGGAGFIGRWVVSKLLELGHLVIAIDNLSNGSMANLDEFTKYNNFKFYKEDVLNKINISNLFLKEEPDVCIHLAGLINVQESLENPKKAIDNNMIGTFNILEGCKKKFTRLVLIGTCMVYDFANIKNSIDEEHPIKPLSPYAASKLSAEYLALSYYYGYGLPITILRPFNTYGPHQKGNLEGGVVSVFIKRALKGEPLLIYGDGVQTRDLLYVEDCATFIVNAAFSDLSIGEIINAGSGKDISINDLAKMISCGRSEIKHVPHHHPHSEIAKLICNYSKANEMLNWNPKISLDEGIKKTEQWIESYCLEEE